MREFIGFIDLGYGKKDYYVDEHGIYSEELYCTGKFPELKECTRKKYINIDIHNIGTLLKIDFSDRRHKRLKK